MSDVLQKVKQAFNKVQENLKTLQDDPRLIDVIEELHEHNTTQRNTQNNRDNLISKAYFLVKFVTIFDKVTN